MTAAFETARDHAVAEVIAAGRLSAGRGWVPATSGNFSVRIDAHTIAITRSGVDKGNLQRDDVLIQQLDQPLLKGSSAEALLHVARYRSHPETNAIFHMHGLHSTVIGQAHLNAGAVVLHGWELQKALSGVKTHEAQVEVPVFANDQDMEALTPLVEARFAEPSPKDMIRAPGYLLAGHGLYAFGTSPSEAMRHLEALEVLFSQVITYGRYQP